MSFSLLFLVILTDLEFFGIEKAIFGVIFSSGRRNDFLNDLFSE